MSNLLALISWRPSRVWAQCPLRLCEWIGDHCDGEYHLHIWYPILYLLSIEMIIMILVPTWQHYPSQFVLQFTKNNTIEGVPTYSRQQHDPVIQTQRLYHPRATVKPGRNKCNNDERHDRIQAQSHWLLRFRIDKIRFRPSGHLLQRRKPRSHGSKIYQTDGKGDPQDHLDTLWTKYNYTWS